MSRLLPPDGLLPPESLLALMPEDEDAVNLAERLPSYPPTFGKETLARVLDEQLEFFAQEWLGKDPDKDRARLGLLAVGSAWLEWPCPERLRGAWAGDVELAYEDLKRYWESPSERKPLASATFPAVMQGEGWRFVWEVYAAPPASDDGGRVGYALYSPGQEKGCALVNNLPDAATRDGFQRAVEAAQCLARQIRQEHGLERPDDLPNLVVWARPLGPKPVFCDHEPHPPLQVARLWTGSSGTLALAVALLSAYLDEPIDATGSLFSGDLRQTDSGWRVESVGAVDLKERLVGALGEGVEFFGAFVEATPGNNPVGQSFERTWQAIREQLAPLISAVGKLADQWDRLPNSARRNSDFDRTTIRFSKAEWTAQVQMKPQEERTEHNDKVRELRVEPPKPEDAEQVRNLAEEEVTGVSFAQFLDEAVRRDFGAGKSPLLLTAGAGMGKTFVSRRAAVERARSWMLAATQGDDPGLLPVWLSLEEIADYTPGGVLEGLLASCPSFTEVEQAALCRAWFREGLLLLLDARDQADRAAGQLNKLCKDLASTRPHVSVVVTTRPIRRDVLWAEFGGWGPGCVEFRQLEFGPRELERFMAVRLGERPDLSNAIQTYAFSDRGRRARLGVPVIAEFSAELALGDPKFLGELERGLTGYALYEKLAEYRLKKALADLDYEPSPDKVRQLMLVLGYTASILFDERPGQNLFTEAELARLRERAGELFRVDLTNEQTGLVLHKSGLLESFIDGGGQANFVHRTLLEFLRGWYLSDQYGRTRTGRWDWTSGDDRFPWSLRTLIEKKGWDEQWREALLFFAQWLDEHSASGPAFAEFLRIVEMEEGDDLLNNRLDLAVRCFRQCWRLYERELHHSVHADVFAWSGHACERFKDLASPLLLPSLAALYHLRDEKFTGPEVIGYQGSEKDLLDIPLSSREHLQRVVDGVTGQYNSDHLREYASEEIHRWAVWGNKEILRELLNLLERPFFDYYIGIKLAESLGAWSMWADEQLFVRLIDLLPSPEESVHAPDNWRDEVDRSDMGMLEALRPLRLFAIRVLMGWASMGDADKLQVFLSILRDRNVDPAVRSRVADALPAWSQWGQEDTAKSLWNVVADSSENLEVRQRSARSLGDAAATFGRRLGRELLDDCLKLLKDPKQQVWLRVDIARLIGSLGHLGAGEHLLEMFTLMESDRIPNVCVAVAESIGRWGRWIQSRRILTPEDNPWVDELLGRLFEQMENRQHDSSVCAAAGAAIAMWVKHGTVSLLHRLIRVVEGDYPLYVRIQAARAIGSWSVFANHADLGRVLALVRLESSPFELKAALVLALRAWVHLGKQGDLRCLLDCLEKSLARSGTGRHRVHEDSLVVSRRSPNRWIIGSVVSRDDIELDMRSRNLDMGQVNFGFVLANNIAFWGSKATWVEFTRLWQVVEDPVRDDWIRAEVAKTLIAWQSGPIGPRRFFSDCERLVADLARLD